MQTSTTVRPGQRGAKKFLSQYGDRLVCVRYRQDAQRQRRFKTVELIVDEWPWTPPIPRQKKESLVLPEILQPGGHQIAALPQVSRTYLPSFAMQNKVKTTILGLDFKHSPLQTAQA